MKCPYCKGNEDRVIDSRETQNAEVIRRRRECLSCGRRYTTYERIEEVPRMVIKKDGRRERFDRNKVLQGLLRACEKRPVKMNALEQMVDDIETLLYDRADKEIPAEEIGEIIMARLRTLDKVAYVRFASVYRQFEDISEFMDEVRDIQES